MKTEQYIDVGQLIVHSSSIPVIDVRSESEFEKGHIPGAINIPVLNNEERQQVGITYHQLKSQQAVLKGFDYAIPKVGEWMDKIRQVAPEGKIIVYCARGGLRSNTMSYFFRLTGMEVFTLTGGYKAYRNYVMNFFSKPIPLFVVGGFTGSGKTEILTILDRKGEQVIDLEKIAKHKGSVLGGLDHVQQPVQQLFENKLFASLHIKNQKLPFWIEDESYSLGKVFIPYPLYLQMQTSKLFFIEIPLQNRIEYLLQSYGNYNTDEIINNIGKLKPYLGQERLENIIRLIKNHHFAEAIELLLQYYDKTYRKSLLRHPKELIVKLDGRNLSKAEIADILIQLKNQ